MKKLLFSILLYFLFQLSYSQDFNKVYFNSNWEITSQKYGVYYRISGFNDSILAYDGKITDFYMDGTIEMTGQYVDGLKVGEFINYYQNHNIKSKSSYLSNNRTGTWSEYYSNGQVKREVEYENNRERLVVINDENGKNKIRNGNQLISFEYYYNPQYESYTENEPANGGIKYILKGKLLNGYKHGEWVLKNENRTICTVVYNNGVFVKGEYFLSSGVKTKMKSDIFTYLILEPEKIIITESFFKEPGQMIRLNYVLKALQKSQESLEQFKDKVELEDESDLFNYFDSKFSLYERNCADTFRITVQLYVNNTGKITVDSIFPKNSKSVTNEVDRVINSISNLKSVRDKKLNLNYRIHCIDELDYKK